MDNRVDVPGYKHYRLRATAAGPPSSSRSWTCSRTRRPTTHGICVPVDDAQLPVIDHRERNYERIDVTGDVTPPGRGTVWAYAGAGRGPPPRWSRRVREGAAVVSRDYLERTRAAFAALGPAALADFEASAALGDLPVWDLQRLEN